MNNDLVSIIIPVYNAEKYLYETIKTIKEQTYQNWEAIFVDDCSNDDSVNIIKKEQQKDKRINIYKLEKNGGNPSIPRNYGLNIAKGRFVCFIDADDLWDEDKLEKQVKFMKKNNIAFSYNSYEFANNLGEPTGKKVIAKEKLTYKECLKNNIISTITVMFDTTKINKELIKMPDFKYVEDTATWWKILRNGHTAYGIPNIFSYYRRDGKSQSSNKIRTLKALWKLYRKEEKLNVIYTIYYMSTKCINALLRRI